MKIEYIDHGSSDCPLIRIHGDELQSFAQLASLCREFSQSTEKCVEITSLPGFEGVDKFTLNMCVGQKDVGVYRCGQQQLFKWILTPPKWETVADLIEPFSKLQDAPRYQWLCGKEARFGLDVSDISVLISNSKDGQW